MFYNFFLFLNLFYFLHADVLDVYRGKELLIRTPQSDLQTFKMFSLEQPSYVVLGEQLDSESEDIRKIFEKAKFSYLENDLDESYHQFHKLESFKHVQHWATGTKQLLEYSFLRLAEFSKEEIDKKRYLKDAHDFSTEQKIDEALFSQNLIKAYKKVKQENQPKIYLLPEKGDTFENIWINGKKQKIVSNFFTSTPGLKLITLASSRIIPESYIISPENLKNIELKIRYASSDSCAERDISPDLIFSHQNIKIFGRVNCENIPLPKLTENINQIAKIEPEIKKNSNKYLWLGLGLVSSALFIHFYNNSNQSSTRPDQPRSIQTNSAN